MTSQSLVEPVCLALSFSRSDEAVAQDGGAVARTQRSEVVGQLLVQGAQILPPQVSSMNRASAASPTQRLSDLLFDLLEVDITDASRSPDRLEVGSTLDPRGAQACLPFLQPAGWRGELENASDVEDHRPESQSGHGVRPLSCLAETIRPSSPSWVVGKSLFAGLNGARDFMPYRVDLAM